MPKLLISHYERFRSFFAIDLSTECWNWKKQKDKEGYGHFKADGIDWLAHRFSYVMEKGIVMPGLVLDHLCRNTSCVNPSHLEAVSDKVNILRGNGITAKQSRQTHCHKGHEFSKENTYINKRGGRQCRKCNRNSVNNYREKKS